MKAVDVQFQNFRNLKAGQLICHPSVNVIYGDNAQGKTNLLEALWLFTGARSFRGAKDGECVAHGQEGARLTLNFEAKDGAHKSTLDIGGRRQATLDGVALKSSGELAGNFNAVVFSPTHLSLIKDGPSERRRFIDTAIGQLWPKYINLLKSYTHCLAQRNAILRDVKYHSQLYDMLEVYDTELAKLGYKIIEYRNRYIDRLKEHIGDIYGGISGGKEVLGLSYISTGGESADSLLSSLKEAYQSDIAAGTTSVGPHRDELYVTVNGTDARAYASQGQQRSAVIALKMSEAAVMTQVSGEHPVALLDDVMSELDEGRQEYILNHIKDWQVFITCCDPSSVKLLKDGAAIKMKNGSIINEN